MSCIISKTVSTLKKNICIDSFKNSYHALQIEFSSTNWVVYILFYFRHFWLELSFLFVEFNKKVVIATFIPTMNIILQFKIFISIKNLEENALT